MRDGTIGRTPCTHLAREGHEMVLAQAVDVNVLDNDHPIVSLVKERVVDDIVEIMMVPLG